MPCQRALNLFEKAMNDATVNGWNCIKIHFNGENSSSDKIPIFPPVFQSEDGDNSVYLNHDGLKAEHENGRFILSYGSNNYPITPGNNWDCNDIFDIEAVPCD